MKNGLKGKLIALLITAAIGALLVVGVLYIQNFGEAVTTVEKYRILSNAFTVPGVLLILFGALIWVTGEGAFAGISYVTGKLFRTLIPFGRFKDEYESYYDYVQKKKEKGRSRGFGVLLIVGGILLAVGIVYLILYHNV